ncbi:hypothetical protein [Rehaibacterium terrae]|jgi:hypothetical protein|uniref:DUF4124 domain-containing protein n=1 Tax=Rehaibacterium terrae TaxID=1341696 RepID=A0A7W7XZ22_9GAMM|nr:hypothetical protein [Rehaibacterium terrae]MBB5015068.1 hypothetical protein [Rehaibacterium terrae]
MPGLLPPLLALALMLPATPASTQHRLNRCLGADGVTIYTDRACADLGARERGAPATPEAREDPLPGCATTPAELHARLRLAIDAGDVNALAALYHWPGTTQHTARAVMAELERLAAQPLTELVAEPGPVPPVARTGPDPPPPVALILQQPAGVTRFAVARHAGCWWLRH